jgi:hypothetical protein
VKKVGGPVAEPSRLAGTHLSSAGDRRRWVPGLELLEVQLHALHRLLIKRRVPLDME